MSTVRISRMAVIIAVAGTIFATGASGCVVHERSVRVAPHPYPVIVGRYPPRPWYAGPKPWFFGKDKRHQWRDDHRRYEAERWERRRDHDGRFHRHRDRFDG